MFEPGRWGAEDQLGTLNLITPDSAATQRSWLLRVPVRRSARTWISSRAC